MVGQEMVQVVAMTNGVAREGVALSELGKAAIGAADARALEVIHVDIGEQMKAFAKLDDLDFAPAIVGDEGGLGRSDQKVESVIVGAALALDIASGCRRTRLAQSLKRQQPARSQ